MNAIPSNLQQSYIEEHIYSATVLLVMSKIVSRLLVLAIAAAWFACSICSARDDFLLMPTEKSSERIVVFNTANVTVQRYERFIANLREEMIGGDKVYGIPRLHNPAILPISKRILMVALYNSVGETVVLAIDKTTADVVAYRARSKAYFFPDTNGVYYTSNVFPGITRYNLPFNSSYSAMEKLAGERGLINLGMGELDKAIQYLYNYTVDKLAPSLLIVSQMISDAVRYRTMERMVTYNVNSSVFRPTPNMISLEDNWDVLSTRIQKSVAGIISPEIMLPELFLPISSINPTFGQNIAVIRHVCDNCSNIPEPTVRIIGYNGLCADVQDGIYDDGNPIILYECRYTNNSNQLWTLKRDGTIRSQGKCLTVYPYVMIHNCITKPEYSGIKWEIMDNGNIINIETKLALKAFTGYRYNVLTLDHKSDSPNQGWSLRNNTEWELALIVAYNGMCIQPQGNTTVLLSSCNEFQSIWSIYLDGTIRPIMSQNSCLKYSPVDKIVGLDLCDGGDPTQRWLFNHDLTISDVNNNNVLEVNSGQKIMLVKRSEITPTYTQIFNVLTQI